MESGIIVLIYLIYQIINFAAIERVHIDWDFLQLASGSNYT